jgi:hypothetical protein
MNFLPRLKKLSVYNARRNFSEKIPFGGVRLYLAVRKREWVSLCQLKKSLLFVNIYLYIFIP